MEKGIRGISRWDDQLLQYIFRDHTSSKKPPGFSIWSDVSLYISTKANLEMYLLFLCMNIKYRIMRTSVGLTDGWRSIFPSETAFPDYELETRGPVYLRGTSLTAAKSLVSTHLSTTYHHPASSISQCLMWEDNAAQTKSSGLLAQQKQRWRQLYRYFAFMVICPNTAQVLG